MLAKRYSVSIVIFVTFYISCGESIYLNLGLYTLVPHRMQAIIHNILQHKSESHDYGPTRFNHLRGKRQYQQRIMNEMQSLQNTKQLLNVDDFLNARIMSFNRRHNDDRDFDQEEQSLQKIPLYLNQGDLLNARILNLYRRHYRALDQGEEHQISGMQVKGEETFLPHFYISGYKSDE